MPHILTILWPLKSSNIKVTIYSESFTPAANTTHDNRNEKLNQNIHTLGTFCTADSLCCAICSVIRFVHSFSLWESHSEEEKKILEKNAVI